jgi:hypothetical protein
VPYGCAIFLKHRDRPCRTGRQDAGSSSKTGSVRHGRRVEALPLALDDQAIPAVLKREPSLALHAKPCQGSAQGSRRLQRTSSLPLDRRLGVAHLTLLSWGLPPSASSLAAAYGDRRFQFGLKFACRLNSLCTLLGRVRLFGLEFIHGNRPSAA